MITRPPLYARAVHWSKMQASVANTRQAWNSCLGTLVYGRHNISLERKIPLTRSTILHGSLSFLITQCVAFIMLISFDSSHHTSTCHNTHVLRYVWTKIYLQTIAWRRKNDISESRLQGKGQMRSWNEKPSCKWLYWLYDCWRLCAILWAALVKRLSWSG